MIITCDKALEQAYYQNSMVLLVIAHYFSNTLVHGCIQLINLHVIHQWAYERRMVSVGVPVIFEWKIGFRVFHLWLANLPVWYIHNKHIKEIFIVSPAVMLKCLRKWSGIYSVKKKLHQIFFIVSPAVALKSLQKWPGNYGFEKNSIGF
jgi:hypothetical protein